MSPRPAGAAKTSAAALLLLAFSIDRPSAWGFVAHRIVAENAVRALPSGMSGFYKSAAERISDASIEPDTILRDREGEQEKRRHYIDLDELSQPPFQDLPLEQDRAREKYGDRRLDEAGHLPWRILSIYDELGESFVRKDWTRAATLSGWLSHYVADAYQPLHSTRNFDGQRSCNEGVHTAFETDMVDRQKAIYRAETSLPATFSAEVIQDPLRFIFSEIIAAFDVADEVLRADSEAVRAVKKEHGDYYTELERRAGPLARRQMNRATATVANLWYSAWVEAGRPELPASAPAPSRRSARPGSGSRSKGGRP